MTAAVLHKIPVRPLEATAFAPYGQIVAARQAGGQGVRAGHDAPREEAELVLSNGTPRVWIMRLTRIGTRFNRNAR